jgi:hypothetical protein
LLAFTSAAEDAREDCSTRASRRFSRRRSRVIAESAQRVREHTAPHVNRRIGEQTARNVAYFEAHPAEAQARLRELDREWDVERALALGSSSLSLLGLALALASRRGRWLLVPIAVQAFYLQHTLQGWCPPLPLLRRLGFRTPREIGDERSALRAVSAGLAEMN